MNNFNPFKVYSGEQFNQIIQQNNLLLTKVLNKQEKHNDFQYQDGLNILDQSFYPYRQCCCGGFYFTSVEYLLSFYGYFGKTIRIVEIPNDAKVYTEIDKFKTNKIILKDKFFNISDFFENFLPVFPRHILYHFMGWIPDNLKTYDICFQSANDPLGFSLKYVPHELKTYEICFQAVYNSGFALEYVPHELKSHEICLQGVKDKGVVLKHVPDELKTHDICLKAIKNDGYALQSIPSQFKTYDFCLEAVKSIESFKSFNASVILRVPDELRTYNMCLEAVKINSNALNFIPEQFRDQISIKQFGLLFRKLKEQSIL